MPWRKTEGRSSTLGRLAETEQFQASADRTLRPQGLKSPSGMVGPDAALKRRSSTGSGQLRRDSPRLPEVEEHYGG